MDDLLPAISIRNIENKEFEIINKKIISIELTFNDIYNSIKENNKQIISYFDILNNNLASIKEKYKYSITNNEYSGLVTQYVSLLDKLKLIDEKLSRIESLDKRVEVISSRLSDLELINEKLDKLEVINEKLSDIFSRQNTSIKKYKKYIINLNRVINMLCKLEENRSKGFFTRLKERFLKKKKQS